MTNYEWLLEMGGEERQAWFDAQHVDANDALTRKGDVRADGVRANDGFMDLDSCTHGVRTFASETDSREKLEADVRKHYAYSTRTLLYPPSANKTTDMLRSLPIDTVVGWLNRQAAITRHEALTHPDERDEQIAELSAQVDKLTAERDAMKVKLDDAVADRDHFIELFREQEARAEKYAKERDNLAADLDDAMRRLAPKAKDGEPIAIGETLYGEDCKAWEVEGFDFSKAPYTVVGVHREAGCGKRKRELKPKWLTHEEPDSWVRIIEDAIRGDGGSYGCLQERFEATVPGLVERCGKLANRRVTT